MPARLTLVPSLALICAFLAACGAPAGTPVVIYVTPPPATPAPAPTPTAVPTPTGHDITVKFMLYSNDDITVIAGGCYGDGGYSDIDTGMQATVHDAEGKVIGFATFTEPGVPASGRCTYTTVVPNVPESAVYGVEVGRRGEIRYKASELAAANWTAYLSLGN